MAKKDFDYNANEHILVPKHTKLDEKEKAKLFEKYKIIEFNLPKILLGDPAIKGLDANPDDIIKIERKSITAGKTVYYRVVM